MPLKHYAQRLENAAKRLLDRAHSDPALQHALSLQDPVSGLLQTRRELNETTAVLQSDKDAQIQALFASSQRALQGDLLQQQLDLKSHLKKLMPPPRTTRGVLLDILASANGADPADFAQAWSLSIQAYCKHKGWTFHILDQHLMHTYNLFAPSGLQGIKRQTAEIKGADAYALLKFENGDHRVILEAGDGRRQTSTIKCLVMPQYEQEEADRFVFDPNDVKVETVRSSGAGGQHVNTTDSKVKLTHLPTGLTVAVQNERSQFQNRAKAFSILENRLLNAQVEATARQKNQLRNQLLGDARIRTYDYVMNRTVDHRLDKNSWQPPGPELFLDRGPGCLLTGPARVDEILLAREEQNELDAFLAELEELD